MRGFVARLQARQGYGFIQEGTADRPGIGEWFFHRRDCDASMPFTTVCEGDAVEFEVQEPEPEKGPRAIHVSLV